MLTNRAFQEILSAFGQLSSVRTNGILAVVIRITPLRPDISNDVVVTAMRELVVEDGIEGHRRVEFLVSPVDGEPTRSRRDGVPNRVCQRSAGTSGDSS